MKMRNKKTGKIQTCDMVVITDEQMDGEIASLNKHAFLFRSVEQFNDNYEAYTPTEPLIKDEKTRKAVRAWAEANGLDKLLVVKMAGRLEVSDGSPHLIYISFHADNETRSNLDDRTYYAIAELCGEEEE